MPLCKNKKKRHLSFVTKVAFSHFFLCISRNCIFCVYIYCHLRIASILKQPNKTVSFCSVYDNKKRKCFYFLIFVFYLFFFLAYMAHIQINLNALKCAIFVSWVFLRLFALVLYLFVNLNYFVCKMFIWSICFFFCLFFVFWEVVGVDMTLVCQCNLWTNFEWMISSLKLWNVYINSIWQKNSRLIK